MAVLMVLCFVVFVVFSALCSGSETGIYRISRVNLRVNAEHGSKLSVMLRNMLDDTNAVIFSILIANNIFNYATTMAATFIFTLYSKQNPEYYATLLATPILFVFGEVIPKNIFFIKADVLTVVITLPLWFIHKFLTIIGITPFMGRLSGLMSKAFRLPPTARSYSNIRGTIGIITDETHHEGHLSRVQWALMNRLASCSNTTIATVMVPLDKVVMIPLNATEKMFTDTITKQHYTRLIVYGKDKRDIIGYINIYEVLNSDCVGFDLSCFVKSINSLQETMTVMEAIKEMNGQAIPIALVEHKNHKLGIITIKDLAGELTGELHSKK